MKISKKTLILLVAALIMVAKPCTAADLPGSKDPASIKRYEGTEIMRYEQFKYDQLIVPMGKMTKFDFNTKVPEFEKSEKVEGALTRVSYRLPDPQRSSLEVFRNYEQSLTADSWEIAWKASGKAELGNLFTHLYENLKDNDQLFTYSDADTHFLAAKKPDQGLYAILFVTKYQYGLTRGLKVNKGDPIVQLDVVQTKQMEQKMVLVNAEEMEKSISQTGRIALYGILFDFNKADIKPESEPTLEEMAKLLKAQPKLRTVITGHTDSVGDFEFNRELSQKRAAAVAKALTAKHGIEASRLVPFGASYASPVATNQTEEGRAKNRRVEIVEIVGTR
jgi:outer membrane protein OmpA-like peptidoglycan-associated protein